MWINPTLSRYSVHCACHRKPCVRPCALTDGRIISVIDAIDWPLHRRTTCMTRGTRSKRAGIVAPEHAGDGSMRCRYPNGDPIPKRDSVSQNPPHRRGGYQRPPGPRGWGTLSSNWARDSSLFGTITAHLTAGLLSERPASASTFWHTFWSRSLIHAQPAVTSSSYMMPITP